MMTLAENARWQRHMIASVREREWKRGGGFDYFGSGLAEWHLRNPLDPTNRGDAVLLLRLALTRCTDWL
jgi:hypothetical protein